MGRDSVFGTFLVATVLCVVCSVLVSAAAVGLRTKQEENKELDRKKNILLAAALCEKNASSGDVDEIYSEKIREVLIDLDSGEVAELSEGERKAYDAVKAAKDPDLNQPVEPASALNGIRQREPYASVYKIVDGETVDGYIFPVYGKGLWSTLYGFLALDADKTTVKGITFYQHAETPGLGGEVDNEGWKSLWPGKKVYSEEGEVALQVVKGKAAAEQPRADYEVDGLSGATITTRGVSDLVQYWLGPEGFGTYLEKQPAT